MSLALDGTNPRSRSTDPVTSLEAGRSVDLNDSQREVLDLFRIAAERGSGRLADHELIDLAAQCGSTYSAQRIRSARAELAELRRVVRVAGEYRPGPSKSRRAQVWTIAA